MKMFKSLVFAALLSAGIGIGATREARAATLMCDGCSEAQRFAQAAAHAESSGRLYQAVYVVDVTGNHVDKFWFMREIDRESGTYWMESEELTPESSVVALVAASHDLSAVLAAAAAAPGANIMPSGQGLPGSVYESMTNPSFGPALNNFIDLSAAGMAQRLHDVVSTFNPVEWFSPDAVVVKARVTFPDGSTAIYTFNKQTGQWERVKGTERDSHGNVVAVSPSDFTSEGGGERVFDFTGGNDQDLIDFLQRAAMLGIPITGPTSRRRIVCVSVGGSAPECRSI